MSSRDNAATSNVTDLRRSRQRARSVVGTLQDAIFVFLEDRGIQILEGQQEHELNQAISELASRTLRQELLQWLERRRTTTMARAARAAFQIMQQVLPGTVSEDAFEGTPNLMSADQALNAEISNIDAGLLYGNDDSLAQELGNQITRQLRLGFADGERVTQLRERVEYVLTEGDSPDRQEAGVSGQTAESRAELIAHDSVQNAYTTAAHKRYLNNGFRYAIYDAVVDFKTTDICERMDEHAIDMIENPWMVPPLHPWCRSGIRPILELGDRTVLQREDIASGFLKTIMSTRGYRPSVMNPEQEFSPTQLTEQFT